MSKFESHNLYSILNIPIHIIADDQQNIYQLMSLIDGDHHENDIVIMNQVIAIFDRYHSYFHFEQSFASLLCAYVFYLSKKADLVDKYLKKAVFQDPLNNIAVNFPQYMQNLLIHPNLDFLQNYIKHYFYEQDFLCFAVRKFHNLTQIKLIDAATNLVLSGNHQDCITLLASATYKSHRISNTLAMAHLISQDLPNAKLNALKSLTLLEQQHLKYHQLASHLYLKRATLFTKLNLIDLAKNDHIKAADFI